MNRSFVRVMMTAVMTGTLGVSFATAQGARMEAYENALRQKLEGMVAKDGKVKVQLGDSKSGGGMDVELRITMVMDKFMEFAPVAALEAAGIPHKFPTVYIVLREETADRVGRIAFADAEPIAGRYLAGDKNSAIAEMKRKIIWH